MQNHVIFDHVITALDLHVYNKYMLNTRPEMETNIFNYQDCFMVPAVLRSTSSTHTYLHLLIYQDCFIVLTVLPSHPSTGTVFKLGYVLLLLVPYTGLGSRGYFDV